MSIADYYPDRPRPATPEPPPLPKPIPKPLPKPRPAALRVSRAYGWLARRLSRATLWAFAQSLSWSGGGK